MSESIKYYMNNPCLVVREITDKMVEIQLNTHFAESVEGSQWCDGCHLGGTVSHTCEEYDSAIDIIRDEEHSIFCIVEARLLHDKPIEIVQYSCIIEKIEALKAELKDRQEYQKEWAIDIKQRQKRICDLNREIEAIKIVKNELLNSTTWSNG